jgi:hypothetical protein
MNNFTAFLISQLVLFPLVAGIIRFPDIRVAYLPIYINLALGFLTEVESFRLIRSHEPNAIPTNLFVLAEWVLIAWQFRWWGLLKRNNRAFYILLAGPVVIWIIEYLVFFKIAEFSPYFRVLYAFLITLMAITEINFKLTHENVNHLWDTRFILCVALILYFVYQILYEWSYQISLVQPGDFTRVVSSLFSYINALTNILFGIAFIRIPRKNRFRMS